MSVAVRRGTTLLQALRLAAPLAVDKGVRDRRVPMILQSEAPECGIACLAMVASFHGLRTDLSAMRLRLSPSLKGVTLKHIAQIAETMGSRRAACRCRSSALAQLRLPAILHWDMNHFVVLTRVAGNARSRCTIRRAASACCALDERRGIFTGVAMEFTPATGFQQKDEREKISVVAAAEDAASGLQARSRRSCCCRFALEVFAIAMPFFLQIVVDRVLVGRDRDLLTVLGIAFCAARSHSVAVITAVRAWVGRLPQHQHQPASCSTTLFNHMLRLPLAWFEKRNIGDIVSQVPERRRDPAHAFD